MLSPKLRKYIKQHPYGEQLAIHVQPCAGRQDPFWYEGLIATCGDLNLYAAGEIRLYDKQEAGWCTWGDCAAVCQDDRGLVKYTGVEGCKNRFEFINNNWFEVVSQNGDMSNECEWAYDDAIKALLYAAADPYSKSKYEALDF